MDAIRQELQSGAGRLQGSTVEGVIGLGEANLNALLAAVAPSGLTLQIRPDNRIVGRLGALHATLVLPRHPDLLRGSQLSFSLASVAVAWTLKHTLKQPYVRIQGRQLVVDLAFVPALRPYRELLGHVTHLDVATDSGALTVRFRVAIR